ncbi:MAG TPA: hypothetical protein VG537_05400, partial [Candidatus Kapabacteria bacterium]|nr:hypothetical protein [Candidatus Kapabacteria bacterium]
MKYRIVNPLLLVTSLFFTTSLFAQDNDRQSVALTVYNNDLGVVRDVRKFDLHKGTADVQMRDVPTRID